MIQTFHLQSSRRRLYVLLKCWYLRIRLHSITSQKTIMFTCATVKGNLNLSIMNKYRYQWCTHVFILNHGTRWSWVASFTAWFTYPRRNNLRCPFIRRLGEAQSWSGWVSRTENLLCMQEFNPAHRYQVASLTSYCGSPLIIVETSNIMQFYHIGLCLYEPAYHLSPF